MTTQQSSPFGEQLRHFREAAGLSQEELGERAGLTASGIGALERGRRTHPYPHTVQTLASALGLTDDERSAFVAAVPRERHETSDGGALAASPRAVPATSTLPVPLSALIGRADEVSALAGMLRSHTVRLVSLTGPGGVGKTRLAIEVASRLQSDFADGIVWVDLSAVRDSHLVLSCIAGAIGVREIPGQSALDSLRMSLRTRHLLLLLDNFERVVEAAPDVVALLESCRGLTALVTSRMMLRVRGEHEVLVRPLSVPASQSARDPSALAQVDAVQLFLQRAQAVVPDFRLTVENAPDIASICVRLDGLPLALELAAVRLKYLAPHIFLDWLENRLAMLVDGARDLPARQQTLRNTLAWSHDLLTPNEQILFRRLAVFVGGCEPKAVEAACATESTTGDKLLPVLSSLVDKNMLQVRTDVSTVPRFIMLETIREYAHERLADSEEEDDVRRRHAMHFLALAEMAEPHLTSGRREEWLSILERDWDNLRAALQWSLTERKQPEIGGRLAGALVWFWYWRGQMSAGRSWLDQARAQTVSLPILHAKVLFGQGELAYLQFDLGAARSSLEESVAIYREIGDTSGLARGLSLLAAVAVSEGKSDHALPLCRESLALLQAAGDRWWEALTLVFLGDASCRLGDPEAARSIWEHSVAAYEEVDDDWGRAGPIWLLGVLASSLGDLATASARYAESKRIFQQSGDKHASALTLATMAASAWQQGENHEARRLWTEAMTIWRNLGNRTFTVLCLGGLAEVAVAQQQREQAACLLGAVASQFRALGPTQISAFETMFPALYRAALDEDALASDARLDDPACSRAWEAGRAMSLGDALSFALSESALPNHPGTPA